MRPNPIRLLLLCAVVWPAAVASATAGDLAPWADPSLPVRDGLVWWIDAGRQDRAYAAHQLPAPVPGGPAIVAFDGSGSDRRLDQRTRDAWPAWVGTPDHAAFRFDGKDDRFEGRGWPQPLKQFTAYIVAAPRSNAGFFRGLVAGNALGRKDYESGFTIDLGPQPSGRFDALSVEGRGFGGASDLIATGGDFGVFRVLEVTIGEGPGGITVRVDGEPQGRRDRAAGPVAVDELTLGARFYSNEAVPNFVQGFFDGDIAEVLIYDRALPVTEADQVTRYLRAKHDGLTTALASDRAGRPLRTVADPPAVQFLRPGFRTRELPVRLTNLNNVRYRADGTLVALAYNGDIHLLRDRDGDGLEEDVQPFFEGRGRLRSAIGMALSPPGDPRGQGVYVASKGKISFIIDEDGDDRADREVALASGWAESAHGVDALGVAVAPDGTVYYGLGTESFTGAYLLDAQGKSHYDLASERGSIVRIDPKSNARTVHCSGIRFPVALAFDPRGALFCTDQEGATWLPNGNPFDELLHIVPGRHYGFPPRHPKHLPGVIDEPSVFDYRPQHQSTCGLAFNTPVAPGGPTFGPSDWAGDALVCGYSRGKLYRTRLVPGADGYTATSELIAVLQKLTVDSCVAPDGSLVVATHSGQPDWGSGPDGPGTLYKVTYADRDRPQPTAAWMASPRELRVAFDRPLGVDDLKALSDGAALVRGTAVTAGERFETLRPGYAVVAAQVSAPRHDLPVRALRVGPDRRTVQIETDPRPGDATIGLTLGLASEPNRPAGALPQAPSLDLEVTPQGIAAEWRGAGESEAWSGWLPHADLAVAQAFTAGSAEHERLWEAIPRGGTLTLRTRLNLRDLLRPAVQPGSTVDAPLPPESVAVRLEASGPIRLRLPETGRQFASEPAGARHRLATRAGELPAESVPVEIAVEFPAAGAPTLQIATVTAEDERTRAVPLDRFRLPWLQPTTEDATPEPAVSPLLAGGDWARGKALFEGREAARCADCHTFRGRGGNIGPDLSNLEHRDPESVLRDIREPNAAINPDHLTYTAALKDGRVLSGIVRSEGDRLHIGDREGRTVVVARDEVEALRPEATSTMPEGLAQALGPDRLRDLLAFLMTPDLAPAPVHRAEAPAPRPRAEFDAVAGPEPAPAGAPAPRPLRLLLVSGPKDHGIDEHDYPLWQRRWSELFSRAQGVTVARADGWPSDEALGAADLVVINSANPGWSEAKAAALDAFLARGGGLVLIHYAVNGQGAPEAFARRIGLAWRGGQSKFRHGSLDLAFPAQGHPITAGFSGLKLEDESYWDLVGDPDGVEVLATQVEDGQPRPLVWTRSVGRGRVFVSIPGHYTWSFDDPLFRLLLLRGMAWAAHEPVDRFRPLALPGTRVLPQAP